MTKIAFLLTEKELQMAIACISKTITVMAQKHSTEYYQDLIKLHDKLMVKLTKLNKSKVE